MHLASSRWTLADVLWNYDPFCRVEHFGNVLNDYEAKPMSAWFSHDTENFDGIAEFI